ncbi:MAG: YitT family protein [Sarcina sp.]|nr:YitT family protein [Sarcina sp.]
MKDLKLDPRNDLRRAVVVAFASVLMALNIKTFVRTGGLYPGGVTGLTVLFQRIALQYFHVELPFSVVNILLNAFPVYVGFKFIGKKFTLLSCEMIVISAVLTDLIPTHPLTYDTLLIAIFGGLINGVVTTLCLRVNATTGGMDFISIYLSQKRGLDGFTIVLGFNAVVLLIAGYFFGWDKALYSIIYQYTTTQTLRLLYRNYQQETLFIVTDKWDEVRRAIYDTCQHGSTIWAAEGGYKEDWRNVVYSVVARSDVKRVTNVVRTIDPGAFINAIPTERILGRFYQEPKD